MDLSMGNLRLSDVKDAQLLYNLSALLTAGEKVPPMYSASRRECICSIHRDAFHH